MEIVHGEQEVVTGGSCATEEHCPGVCCCRGGIARRSVARCQLPDNRQPSARGAHQSSDSLLPTIDILSEERPPSCCEL